MRALRFILVGALSLLGLSVVVSPPANASMSVDQFEQCQNQTLPYSSCNAWTNGTLNNSNHYAEDMVVPQRAVISVTDGASYTFSTTYDDLNGNQHGYDYLATWNYSETTATPCLGLAASLCSGAPSSFDMKSDPATRGTTPAGISNVVSAHELPQANRQWVLYGGTITASSVPSHSTTSGTATVTFHANPGVTQMVLLYGGHLAVGGPNIAPRAWGAGNGASSYPGGSLSIALTGSNKTNGIQTNAVAPLPPAQFTITKSANPTSVSAGQSVTYTITVTNTGGLAGTTTFTDDYDNRLSPSTATSNPSGNNCTPAAGIFTCTTGTIAPHASQTFTYTAAMPSVFSGGAGTGGCAANTYPVGNTATITGGNLAGGGGPASATVCVGASAQFTVTKAVSSSTAIPGGMITYTITVTNNGSAAGSTTFTDDFDNRLSPSTATSNPAGNNCTPGTGTFSCTTGTIAAGGQQTFTYTAQMPQTFDGGAGTGGCAAGSYPVANSVTSGSSSDAKTVCVSAAAAFTVTKSVDNATPQPGQTVTYTITVTNNGKASGSTTFTDDFDNRLSPSTATSNPAGNNCTPGTDTFSCTTGTILAGGSQTFTYTAKVPDTFTGTPGGGDCGPGSYRITNTVSAGTSTDSQDVCVPASPAFIITKSVDHATVSPGATVAYTVTVTNNGKAAGSTSFTDDYDNRLHPGTVVSTPLGANCSDNGDTISCTTSTINAGDSQIFTYLAKVPDTFTGTSGGGDCGPGTYRIANTATLTGTTASDSQDVCVTAAPAFTVTKSVNNTTVSPGDTVTYTVTVHNTGTASGTTAFTDDYDNRLDPSTVTSNPAGASCSDDGDVISCTTGTVNAGSQQTFTYTAKVPASFTGLSGGNGCATGSYPIVNTASIGSTSTDHAVVCVTAAPSVTLVKSSTLDTLTNGDQVLTYTLRWTNTGPAEAVNVVVTDPIPTGTAFVSCTGGCSTSGSPATATWTVGSIAPLGGTDSVTLKVKVTTNQACSISNTAQLRIGSGSPISSNTVTDTISPVADPSGAHSSGSALGVQVKANGLLSLITGVLNVIVTNSSTGTIVSTSSSQTGVGFNSGNDSLLSARLPSNGSLVSADVLAATSSSSVTAAPAEARQLSSSELAHVCLVKVSGICTVETDTVRAVASTMANGQFATGGSAGSTIQNLKIVGLGTPVDLNQTTLIPLNPGIFGKNSYVAINERTSTISGANGRYSADASVTMIHVKITGILGGVQAIELLVGQAKAHSDFPKTFSCNGPLNQQVSGHAFNAFLYTGPLIADLLQGYVAISPLGGDERQQVVALTLPANGSVAGAQVADSRSTGSFDSTGATARSYAEIAGDGTKPACVLRTGASCIVTATAIRSEARSNANITNSTSTDTGSQLVGLSVLGIPIAAQPAPNTTIKLPGIGFVILNEQFCDNGTFTSTHSCTGVPHSGITVRALHVVITVANNILGLSPGVELIVSEAHADSSFG